MDFRLPVLLTCLQQIAKLKHNEVTGLVALVSLKRLKPKQTLPPPPPPNKNSLGFFTLQGQCFKAETQPLIPKDAQPIFFFILKKLATI